MADPEPKTVNCMGGKNGANRKMIDRARVAMIQLISILNIFRQMKWAAEDHCIPDLQQMAL